MSMVSFEDLHLLLGRIERLERLLQAVICRMGPSLIGMHVHVRPRRSNDRRPYGEGVITEVHGDHICVDLPASDPSYADWWERGPVRIDCGLDEVDFLLVEKS